MHPILEHHAGQIFTEISLYHHNLTNLFQKFLQMRVISISRGTINPSSNTNFIEFICQRYNRLKKNLHFQVDFIPRQDECANINALVCKYN